MRWSNGLVPRVRDLCWPLCLLALPAVADRAYVTCQNGDALGVIDLSAGETVVTWDVPGKPAGVAVTSGSVFTVSADSKTVHRFASASGTVLAARRLDAHVERALARRLVRDDGVDLVVTREQDWRGAVADGHEHTGHVGLDSRAATVELGSGPGRRPKA